MKSKMKPKIPHLPPETTPRHKYNGMTNEEIIQAALGYKPAPMWVGNCLVVVLYIVLPLLVPLTLIGGFLFLTFKGVF